MTAKQEGAPAARATPGSWRTEPSKHHGIAIVAPGAKGVYERTVARVEPGKHAGANAKLIAAAPALADALQAIVEAYEGNVEHSSLLAGAAAALRAAGRLP